VSKKSLIKIFGIVGLILIIPLIAMQFNNGVDWSTHDFILAFILLTFLGVAIDYILREPTKYKHKVVMVIILIIISILAWIELAVGIF
jgi:hypothetical protein